MIDEVDEGYHRDDHRSFDANRPERVLLARLGPSEVAVGRRDVVTIGRHRHATLRSNHERVSRRHATIRGEADGWYFVDESSLNGSYLGDEVVSRLRIDTTVVIRLGDQRNGPILELHVPSADRR